MYFVEEEIKAGGFGMMLSDKLRDKGFLKDTEYRIIAAEDPFVVREVGQSYLEASGLDFKSLAKIIADA